MIPKRPIFVISIVRSRRYHRGPIPKLGGLHHGEVGLELELIVTAVGRHAAALAGGTRCRRWVQQACLRKTSVEGRHQTPKPRRLFVLEQLCEQNLVAECSQASKRQRQGGGPSATDAARRALFFCSRRLRLLSSGQIVLSQNVVARLKGFPGLLRAERTRADVRESDGMLRKTRLQLFEL